MTGSKPRNNLCSYYKIYVIDLKHCVYKLNNKKLFKNAYVYEKMYVMCDNKIYLYLGS